jgi:polyphenol oxidase
MPVSGSAPGEMPVTEDLGGGFVYLRRVDGSAAIIASGMADSGAVGLMSASDVNAREDDELRRWLTRWAFPDHAHVRRVNQVHGAAIVDSASYDGAAPDADGIWTRSPADVLVVRVADCAALWFVDRGRAAMALAHAGWRGVAAGIVERGIDALQRAGADLADVRIFIGPHLGPCCFEVGPEVATAFADDPGAVRSADALVVERRRSDSSALDLTAAIAHRAAISGVGIDRVASSTACTRCRDDILHSYRRNGAGGPLMASVGAVVAR